MAKKTYIHPTDLTPGTNPHLFETVLNASGVAMAIRDSDLITVYANQAFADFYEYTASELQALPRTTILLDETLKLFTEEVLPAMHEGRSWEGEHAIQKKSGDTYTVWGRFTPVMDDNGTLTHVISTMQEASDSSRIRKALDAAEQSLNFISNSTSDIFFRLTIPDGAYDYLSPSAERFSGYTLQEYEDNPLLFKRIVHPDWQDYFEETWQEFLRGESRPEYEFQFVHKSGAVRWAHQRVILHKDTAGNPIAIEGIATDVTDRKKAEQTVKSSEEKFRFLTENITDIIWTMDEDYRFTYITPSVERLLGYPIEKVLNKTIFDMTAPESVALLKQARETRVKEDKKGNFVHLNRLEMEHFKSNGSIIWMETVVGRLLDEDGCPNGYQGVSRDVTQRRETERKISKSEARFRTLFEDSPISLWEEDLSKLKMYFDELKEQGVTDFKKHFYAHPESLVKCASLVEVVDINKATLDLLGARSKEELFGNLDKVLTESSMAAFTEEMILLASGGCEYRGEITHQTLNGETIWVMVHFLVPDEYKDTLSKVLVSLLDVTPRKKVEEALMDSEERYRILAENSQEGVVVIQGGKIRYINESMAEIFGYPTEKFRTMNHMDVVHPDDKELITEQLKGVLSGEEKDAFASFRIVSGHGDIKWLTINVKPIMWGGEEAQLEILTDVTHHKTLEKELLIAHAHMEDRIKKRTAELSAANILLKEEAEERTKAQQRILSLTQELIRIQEDERQRISLDLHDNVAQDLSSIMLKFETLFDDQDTVDEKLVERGNSITKILRKAISSVRDIAYGLRPPALDQLGLVSALENLCKEEGSRNGFTVDFFATGIESIPMDFDAEINIYRMIQEAVRNISRHAQANKATIRLVKSHPNILIRIEDNGQGFDPEERMTETANEKRMGVRSMEERARLIGGTMEIQSLPGTGTRIIFKVPIENARRQE